MTAAVAAATVEVKVVVVTVAAVTVAVKVVVVTVAAAMVTSLQPFWPCTAKLIPQHGGATGQGRVGLIYVRRAFDPRASGPRHDRTGG